jgi:hypothetical protein
MIRVAVEIREHAVVRRVKITAQSIERALSMAGKGRPDREVRLLCTIDAERYFARDEGRKFSREFTQAGEHPAITSKRHVEVAA